jgi:hypothetical protein
MHLPERSRHYLLTSKQASMKKIFLLLVAHGFAHTITAQGLVRINGGATFKTSGSVYFILNNTNVLNNGILKQSSGNGFVVLTGGSDVSLSGSGIDSLNTVLLAKSGGATFSLQSNLAVASNVNFNGGLLNLNNSVLNLGSTGSFSYESESSRAYTNGSGYIEASGNLNAPTSVNLGNLGAVISSPANMGNTIVRRGHAIQNGVSGSNNSIRRYYDIIPANNLNLKAVLDFYYFDAELNGIPETSLYQWKSKDNITWNFTGADVRDVSYGYSEKKAINWFGRWTLATATAPSITCPNNVTVSSNQKGCKASVSFAAAATGIPAPTITYSIGNTVITSPYVFSKGTTTVTATASNGVLPDATCAFTVTVVCGTVTSPVTMAVGEPQETIPVHLTVTARPNPSASYFTLDIKSSNRHPVVVRITDVLGRTLAVKPEVDPNSSFKVGDQYLPGVYFVQVVQEKSVVTLKLIKD